MSTLTTKTFTFFTLCLLFLSACRQTAVTPTTSPITPLATSAGTSEASTPQPATATPTSTPKPTATPLPTSTVEVIDPAALPLTAVEYLDLGRDALAQADAASALYSLRRAVALDPNGARAYLLQAQALYQLGEQDAAFESINQAIENDPNEAEGYYQRALFYRGEGEMVAALADFSQALALRPDWVEAYLERANLLVQMGDVPAAVADLELVLTLTDDPFIRHLVEGQLAQLTVAP